MKQISVLGCGWLGLPLAKALIQKEYTVKGSTTSPEKISLLENSGIQSYVIELESDNAPENISCFFEGSEIIIIAIPPKLRGKNKDYSDANNNSFVKKIANLLPLIAESTIKKLLFISSTAVYGDASGTVDEYTKPVPVTESGKQLLTIEELLFDNSNFKTTVLRFGGLIGEDRNPARFLAGKANVANPEAAINLIHQEDCIAVILKIIERNAWGESFNAVAPYHPTRSAYYTEKAIENNLLPPSFDYNQPSVGKTIDSEKLVRILEYQFIKPQL
ncbi:MULTISPECIES: SDR family oxidoreductase [unclassified Flavobacterium]|uniref:SDR family oxidoreductase n=1 Tax=unclassified Flavobacterium TaxID=196869 RepID=UPI003F8E2009